MADHPEFPQETNPAILYIIGQVSKIEDAQACATGYYNSLKKVLSRLDKLDNDLNQSKQLNSELKDVIAADGLSRVLQERLHTIGVCNHRDMMTIRDGVTQKVGEDLADIKYSHGKLNSEQLKLIEEIRATNKKVDDYQERIKVILNMMTTTIFPPWYKVWGLRLFIFAFGILVGGRFFKY